MGVQKKEGKGSPSLSKKKPEQKKRKNPPKYELQPDKYTKTFIGGLDELLVDGLPRRASIIICGGTGSGKTILNLQLMSESCKQGKKCLYITLEEAEDRL